MHRFYNMSHTLLYYMKKLFTLSLLLAVCATVKADTTRLLNGIPTDDEPELQGFGISPNGRYVCGTAGVGAGIFVADLETGKISWTLGDPDEEGNQLRHVDNNGLGIGFTAAGVTYSIDGVLTSLDTPEGDYKYVLGEDITGDGSMMVGSLVGTGFVTKAAYCKDGGEWTLLPEVTEEQLGGVVVRASGSAAKCVSSDGKVILGCLGSFTVPVLWVMNDEGEYEVDFFVPRYMKVTGVEADLTNDEKPMASISGAFFAMSDNGRYVALMGVLYEEINSPRGVPMVYDTVEKTMKYYTEVQEGDERGIGLYPTAICDNGTFVGTFGMPMDGHSCIMEADATQAELFVDAFPSYAEIFAEADSYGFNVPTAMSADGSRIIGYSCYSANYFTPQTEDPQYYTTYVIDVNGKTDGIESSVVDKQAVPVEYYSVDGQRVSESHKGFTIVRMSDGSARKVVK